MAKLRPRITVRRTPGPANTLRRKPKITVTRTPPPLKTVNKQRIKAFRAKLLAAHRKRMKQL